MVNLIENIKQVLETTDLDKTSIAEELFPGNKHARLAFNRVLKGKSELSATQLSKLSYILDLPIEDLFRSDRWKSRSDRNTIRFTRGEYTAVLDRDSWTTRLYHKNSLFHTEVIHDTFIRLVDYINSLDSLITNHHGQDNN